MSCRAKEEAEREKRRNYRRQLQEQAVSCMCYPFYMASLTYSSSCNDLVTEILEGGFVQAEAHDGAV